MTDSAPPLLKVPNYFLPPPPQQEIFRRLSLRLHTDDGMFSAGNVHHYLYVGLSALNMMQVAMQIADRRSATNILDFGAGAGRVMRWMRAAWPEATITAAEIREDDLAFCADAFGARTWNPGIDFDNMAAPGSYDLIWVGSVLTHLPADRARQLLRLVLQWTRKHGLALLSFHGRHAFSRRPATYIAGSANVAQIEADYAATGFGYADYQGMYGYGVSFCTPEWIVAEVQKMPDCRLVCLSERSWDGHHDVIALERL
jgi:SAM-dependent methyltransferase